MMPPRPFPDTPAARRYRVDVAPKDGSKVLPKYFASAIDAWFYHDKQTEAGHKATVWERASNKTDRGKWVGTRITKPATR